ncbi:cysteine--tRNA ligase, chloroplastic/mitochondrial isoform X3 [Nicotiana tabacum]|uniref:Cysteine--tRNA ligase, chloroplastic/mitochondrial isoform X3 n=1 Tax=Nicotiana tabacum TaxID=4097 RepID=A0AC58RN58_TOBAC
MYICGVSPYDFSHIGHARSYVAFDVLYRYLKYLRYDVVYVCNFSDVDEKIIRRANEFGEDPIALSGRYCQEFQKDMDDLQCLPPTHQPRVSEHMEEIKEMIAKVMTNGYAYTVDGDVYFSVDSFPEYGRLSGRKLEDNRAGGRLAVDSRKRNPADFALWKAAKPGEPSWDSPWGRGRPGWHIECSAMSAYYLTHSFDIHGGGMDLIFPHHENEIAQNCAACGPESNVSCWIHNGFVTIDDEKMSKSLGNFFTIREVTQLYHPIALRYFLLGTHYRSPVNYSISQIEIASESVYYIYQVLQQFKERALKRADLTEEDILRAIEERALARKNKEFARSDQIRTDLVAKGIALMDIGTETVWRPCVRRGQEQPAPPAQLEQSAAAVQKEPPVAPSQLKQSAAARQKEQPAASLQPPPWSCALAISKEDHDISEGTTDYTLSHQGNKYLEINWTQ